MDNTELQETYSQVDWSAMAIYVNNLDWFDGRPERRYHPPAPETAAREVALIGGAVRALARLAIEQDDPRWTAYLLANGPLAPELTQAQATALEAVAAGVINTNGRAYLLESAHELRHGLELQRPRVQPQHLVQALFLDFFGSHARQPRLGGHHGCAPAPDAGLPR
ncbi:hypothetical protein DFAR_920005 [Desulfarculales bacterium]